MSTLFTLSLSYLLNRFQCVVHLLDLNEIYHKDWCEILKKGSPNRYLKNVTNLPERRHLFETT